MTRPDALRAALTDQVLADAIATAEPEYRGLGFYATTPKQLALMRDMLLAALAPAAPTPEPPTRPECQQSKSGFHCDCRYESSDPCCFCGHVSPTPEPLDRAAIILAAVEQLMLPHRTGMAPYEVLQRSAYNRAVADVLRLLTGGTEPRKPVIDPEPECPGPDCVRCSGEYCERHITEPCGCDVIARHYPETDGTDERSGT